MLEADLRGVGLYGEGELGGNVGQRGGKGGICKAWNLENDGLTHNCVWPLENPCILPRNVYGLLEERIWRRIGKQGSCGYLWVINEVSH